MCDLPALPRHRSAPALLAAAGLILLGAGGVRSARAAAPLASFTVNSTGDEADQTAGDGSCRSSAGTCTLRAAIEEANAREGEDEIRFGIGSGAVTIQPETPLPVIFEAVTMDGSTQPGYAGAPLVAVDGSQIEVEDIREGPGIDGLVFVNGKHVLRALVVHGFGGAGVVFTEGDGNRLEGTYVGTDASGTQDLGNGDGGIVITRSADNVIGGTEARQRNLVAGNDGAGLLIEGGRARGNRVLGNVIGLAADGSALPNEAEGILILDAPENEIGGTAAAAGNIVAGNAADGIEIAGVGASENVVRGNLIGARGAVDPGNEGSGVVIDGAPDNVIGGPEDARNWIAGNGGDGVSIVGGDARGNRVQGNWIGLATDGRTPRGNGGDGVLIAGAPENEIGGPAAVLPPAPSPTPEVSPTPGAGTPGPGEPTATAAATADPRTASPTPDGTPDPRTPGATPGATGTVPLPTPGLGRDPRPGPSLVRLPARRPPSRARLRAGRAQTDTVTETLGAGNVIVDAGGDGVEITGTGARGNRLRGNAIGATAALTPTGNAVHGVFVNGAPGNVIGGPAAEGNAIAANGGSGVALVGVGASGNAVLGNRIGLGEVRADLGNDLGNEGEGVWVLGAARNEIGRLPEEGEDGETVRAGNRIAGNGGDGVRIAGDGADENRVAGNDTSAAPSSRDGANRGSGVTLIGGARRNAVEGNTLRDNGRHGVEVIGTGTDRNEVRGNAIGGPGRGNGWGGGDERASGGAGVVLRGGARENRVLGNEIRDNARSGIHCADPGTVANRLEGNTLRDHPVGILIGEGARENLVGTHRDGSADGGNALVGNDRAMELRGDANEIAGNRIGPARDEQAAGPGEGILVTGTGNRIGPGNEIRDLRAAGVWIRAGSGNRVLRNEIAENAGLAIDLGRAGPGGAGEANEGMRAPVWDADALTLGALDGQLVGEPEQRYQIDVYGSAACRDWGADAARWLGRASAETDEHGLARFRVALDESAMGAELLGLTLGATATSESGSTSEVSGCARLVLPQAFVPIAER